MKLQCPGCGAVGSLPEGIPTPPRAICPKCQHTFAPVVEGAMAHFATAAVVPEAPQPKPIFCSHCGKQNRASDYRCAQCGAELYRPQAAAIPATPPATSPDPLGGLIPYKNPQALLAYYFGVFSLIPLLGILLGVIAIILGIMGLGFAKRNPQAKGVVHAWVGIVLGAFSVLFYCGAIVLLLIASSQ